MSTVVFAVVGAVSQPRSGLGIQETREQLRLPASGIAVSLEGSPVVKEAETA